jgi:formylglycine-generating enzyme required for sulfatase activity
MSRRPFRSLVLVSAAACVLACPTLSHAEGVMDRVVGANPDWMVAFEATKDQPVGLDEDALKTWVHKTLKSKWATDKSSKEHFKKVWEESILLQSPEHKVEVPAFSISKWEVTNAQWARFLEHRQAIHETQKDETLEEIAIRRWRIAPGGDAGKQTQKAWKTLLARNADVLLPVLNPEAKEKWDPVRERAQSQKLPAGLELHYWRIAPPLYWADDGSVPEHEAKKPIHYLSWEEADDFARWAGLHLPTEYEWERAARGHEGRLFPWGNDWDPLKLIWQGFNEQALRAKKGDELGVKLPGSDEVLSQTPCPIEVDRGEMGATPEGLHHMMGNVYEYTSSRLKLYPGSKTTNSFYAGNTCVARGGSWNDERPEILLASDRNAEGHAGPLSPTHKEDTYGLRVAMYPVAGADLTQFTAQRLNEDPDSNGPRAWLPSPIGLQRTDPKAPIYAGFDPQRTAGVLERQLVSDDARHVFVTGPAKGIALLPIRGIPADEVKSKSDLEKIFAATDQLSVIGVLTGTEQSGFRLRAGEGEASKSEVVAFADERLACRRDERITTQERLGAVVAIEGQEVVLYRANDTMKSAARHREGRIGRLEFPATFEVVKGVPAPTATRDGGEVVLTTAVPLLDRSGRHTGGQSVKITLRVPWVEDVAGAK